MKRLQHIGVLSAVFCVVAVPWAQAQNNAAEEWKVSTSDAGRFKVALPAGKPQRQTMDLDTDLGKVEFHVYGVETEGGNTAYMVMHCDYPIGGLSADMADQTLEAGRDGALRNLGGVVTREKKLTLEGNPGLEFHFTGSAAGRKAYGAWRMYLVKNRLYQVAALRFGQPLVPADVQRFFASFKLLDGRLG